MEETLRTRLLSERRSEQEVPLKEFGVPHHSMHSGRDGATADLLIQLNRQSGWRGLDFDPQESASSVAFDATSTPKQESLTALSSWISALLIGLGTGGVGWFIDFCIRNIVKLKYDIVYSLIATHPFYVPLLVFCVINLFLVGVASAFVVCIETAAAGSGIPEIKAELNGVKVPRVLRMKTLIVKATGVLFSVAGSMPVGKEGPMIHSGAILGAGVSQGGSWTLGIPGAIKINRKFRNDPNKRDFIACGAAAGVSAAFGAPIGGVLFAIEEGASFWSVPLTWRAFLCALTATYTLNIFISLSEPGLVGKFNGFLDTGAIVTFGLFSAHDQHTPWTLQELPLFALLGGVMGLTGAFFNFVNLSLTKVRMRHVPVTNGRRRFVEALCISLCVSLVMAFVPLCFSEKDVCLSISAATTGSDKRVLSSLQRYFCDENEFNQAATLLFSQSESSILQLFHSPFNFSWAVLTTYFILYLLLACVTYGIAIPSGLFVPSLTSGAVVGRLFGEVANYLLPNLSPPGTYALMGAAGMLGGMARITISAVVIIIESTQNVSYALPVSMTIFIAKLLGDVFNEGLYDEHNKLKGVPFLEQNPPKECASLIVGDLLPSLPPPISLPLCPSVRNLVQILKTHKYGAFPIVEFSSENPSENSSEPYTLAGIISRDRLSCLIKNRVFSSDEIPAAHGVRYNSSAAAPADPEFIFYTDYPRFTEIENIPISDSDLPRFVDLSPFMCPCPLTLRETAPLNRAYRLFRQLGVRHIPIVDRSNRLLAVLTRKSLTEPAAEHLHHTLQLPDTRRDHE